MMPLILKLNLFTKYPPKNVPPPPAGIAAYPGKKWSKIEIRIGDFFENFKIKGNNSIGKTGLVHALQNTRV